jgi:DNA-binding response OmpR family regulator
VDDEPMIAKSIRRAFPNAEVVAAHTGAQGIALLQASAFDLVLCDLMMPDMTGMNVYVAVQRRCAETAQRIVFMTGGSFLAEVTDFLATIPNRCLKKPFAMDEIRKLLPQI